MRKNNRISGQFIKQPILELLPIYQTPEENKVFESNTDCRETLEMTVEFYEKVGYTPPWTGYYVKKDKELVGMAAFKGRPIQGRVEIAYGTMERFRNQGIGAGICRLLVELSLQTDPSISITARTLPEPNYSTRILQKNNFVLLGTVEDPEDGEVWEWIYQGRPE